MTMILGGAFAQDYSTILVPRKNNLPSASENEVADNPNLQIQALMETMTYELSQNNIEAAIEYGERALEVARRNNLVGQQAEIMINVSRCYQFIGNRVRQFELSSEALRLVKGTTDTATTINSINSIGDVHKKMDEIDTAKSRYLEALALAQAYQDSFLLAQCYTNIGTYWLINYIKHPDDVVPDSALLYLNRAVSYYLDLGDVGRAAAISIRVGRVYLFGNDLEMAEQIFRRVVRLAIQSGANHWRGRGYHYLSRTFQKQKQFEQALYWSDSAGHFLRAGEDILLLMQSYRMKSLLFDSLGRSDSSFIYFKRSKIIEDTLAHRKNFEQVKSLEWGYKIKDKEKQIEILKEKKRILKQKRAAEANARTWLRIALIGTIAVCILLFFLFRQRARSLVQEKELREVDKARAEQEKAHERELRQVEREKYQLDLEGKNKELTTLTMQMLRKSEEVNDIDDQLRNLDTRIDRVSDVRELVKRELQKISRGLSTSKSQEQEWEQFKLHFEQVHTNFFSRLKNKHPVLTPYDLKLCAYFHMNLDIKQVANIMSVSHDAIKKQRTRMRKKMDLPSETNLLAYLQQVGGNNTSLG